jgi:hypothetical protein
MDDLHHSDVVFVATHSQGSVVATHLIDRLIRDNHIRTAGNTGVRVDGGAVAVAAPAAGITSMGMGLGLLGSASAGAGAGSGVGAGAGMDVGRKPHRICCLALCGIHLGPLRYLKSSSLVKPYIQVGLGFFVFFFFFSD